MEVFFGIYNEKYVPILVVGRGIVTLFIPLDVDVRAVGLA